MIIIGLGTNLGDKLANLREAYQAILAIPNLSVQQVSPVYISDALLPENAPPEWNQPYLNAAIRCTSPLSPLDLLHTLKKIENQLGRDKQEKPWGPRLIDLDILAWDDCVLDSTMLTLPHQHLCHRPFALWPLADIAPFWVHPILAHTATEIANNAWGSRFDGSAPFHTRQINQRIDTAQLVGILNVTPDSFSDGGTYQSTEQLIKHAVKLVEDGANVIDIGAESTAVGSTPLSAESEWARLADALEAICTAHYLIPPKISVDTYQPLTAKRALERGVNWINDVSGLTYPAMRDVLRESSAQCVIMHYLSIPASHNYKLPLDCDVVETVYTWGEKQIAESIKSGIEKSRLIFDPGIGFGKHPAQSLALLQCASRFRELGVPILIGHSRKGFLSLFAPSNAKEREIETAVISGYLSNHVDYLRVHDVRASLQAIKVANCIRK